MQRIRSRKINVLLLEKAVWVIRKTLPEVTEKVLELRNAHNMGPMKIVYYLKRYHGIDVSESTVYRILKAHGVSRMGRGKI